MQWMHEREQDDDVRGGLLCDEMGLGKTITTVAFMYEHPVNTTLILCPLAVVHQWVRSIKSVGGSDIYVLNKQTWRLVGGAEGVDAAADAAAARRVYIANYDKLISASDTFTLHFDRVFCDEAHVLRNYETKKTSAVKALETERYWMLTGTPIVNGGSDLASLMHILSRTINPGATWSKKVLADWMQRYALSRSVEQLREDIPHIFPKEPIVKHHRIEFTTEEEALFYRGIQSRIAAQLMHLMAHDNVNSLAFLTLLLRLRQISVHPQVYIAGKKRSTMGYGRPDWSGISSKVNHIINILKDERKSEGVVVFCNFKDEMDILEAHLKELPCVGKVLMYHGGLNDTERADVIAESETEVGHRTDLSVRAIQTILDKAQPTRLLPEVMHEHIRGYLGIQHTVMLVQIQCGGTGLNLQHMSRVIFTTPWWTAALMDQAAGRVLRIGQKQQVVIHHIHLREEDAVSLNIDNYINEKVERKRGLCTDLLAAANHTAVSQYIC
jgi:SNF2 family DNA or RNA helicase